jgi:hypothetical protein
MLKMSFGPPLQDDTKPDAGSFTLIDHCLGISGRESQRFFYQNMFASYGGGDSLGRVLAAGRTKADDMNGRIGQNCLIGPARHTKAVANGGELEWIVMANRDEPRSQMSIGLNRLPVIIGDHARP